MNTSRKLKIILILFLLVFPFFKVNALTVKNNENYSYKLLVSNNTITNNYVAENPCNEDSIKKVLRIFGYILQIARLAIPLIIIGVGTFDLFKAVTSEDDKSLKKQVKILIIRVIIGVFVFFIPGIINMVFKLSDQTSETVNNSGYKVCAKCLINPNSCS